MTRYLRLAEVLKLHDLIIFETGSTHGLRDLGLLESSLGHPQQTFGGDDLYPSWSRKAAALGFSLIKNHPFVNGNKRVEPCRGRSHAHAQRVRIVCQR